MRVTLTAGPLGLIAALLIAAGPPSAIAAGLEHGFPVKCGDHSGEAAAGWYDLRAFHVGCGVAGRVARRFWQRRGAPGDGWICATRSLGGGNSAASCTRRRERQQNVRFTYTARHLISGEQVITGPLGTKPFDTFTRSDGGIGADWLSFGAPFVIDDHTLMSGGRAWSEAGWVVPYPAPHEVFATLVAEPKIDDDYAYLELLDDPDATSANGYAIELDDNYWDIFRIDDGVWTRLNAWSWVHDSDYFRSGETAAMTIEGSDLVAYRLRAGAWQELGRVTDETHRPSQLYRAVELAPQAYVRLDNVGGGSG